MARIVNTFTRPTTDQVGARFTNRPGEIAVGSADDVGLTNAEVPNPVQITQSQWTALMSITANKALYDSGVFSLTRSGSKLWLRNESRGRIAMRMPDAPEAASTPAST